MKIEDDNDALSDDPFTVAQRFHYQLSILNKTFEDVTVEDVASFDDMLVSTQESLSDENILAWLSAADIEDQHECDKDNSQSEVSEVLNKANPSQALAAIEIR